jgi:thiol:disulfide interchange protein DsbC
VLGPDSERQVRQLGCARDKKAATDALLSGRIGNLDQDDACNLEPMQRTLVTAQILGIQGVPFIVANDGRISRGRPYDLSAWLEGRY